MAKKKITVEQGAKLDEVKDTKKLPVKQEDELTKAGIPEMSEEQLSDEGQATRSSGKNEDKGNK